MRYYIASRKNTLAYFLLAEYIVSYVIICQYGVALRLSREVLNCLGNADV